MFTNRDKSKEQQNLTMEKYLNGEKGQVKINEQGEVEEIRPTRGEGKQTRKD